MLIPSLSGVLLLAKIVIFLVNISYIAFECSNDLLHLFLECHSQDRILTLVSFHVYKEWLLFSLADKKRNSTIMLEVNKNELALCLKNL